MEAKMTQFFDSVGNFFTGGDNIPWCDRDIIAGCERELADAATEEQRNDSLMRISWALVHSKHQDDVHRGISMIEASLDNSSSPLQTREKLYLLAVGKYRTGDYSRSRQLVERCLEDDLASRIRIMAHATFLSAGFASYDDGPIFGHHPKQVEGLAGSSSARSVFSCRYTVAQLARDEDAAATVAVQEVRVRGNGDVTFQVYILRSDGNQQVLYEVNLDEATGAWISSFSLVDAVFTLRPRGPGSEVMLLQADWVFPGLLLALELCRWNWNVLPETGESRFTSLPDDAKVEILKRLSDGKDLAMVESTSRQLRRLVMERDGELWKAMYASLRLGLLSLQADVHRDDSEGLSLSSWKERYISAWRRQQLRFHRFRYWLNDEWLALFQEHGHLMNRHARPVEVSFSLPIPRHPSLSLPLESTGLAYPPVHDGPPAPRRAAARAKHAIDTRQHGKVQQRNVYQKNKHHGAGAIHSASSRYKWKHR